MPTDIPDLPIRLAILGVTFCLSALFSGSETALFSFQPHELDQLGRPGAGRADHAVAALRRRPKRLLVTILFGNMLVNVVFYSVFYMLVVDLSPGIPAPAAVLLSLASLAAIIIGGEVMPKNLAVTFHRPVGRTVAVPLLVLQRALLPVLFPLEKAADFAASLMGHGGPSVRAEELQMFVALSAHEGALDPGAGQMISEVIELSDMRVSEIMVPRVEMVSFDLGRPEAELTALFQSEKLTAIPVYQGDMDEMRGVVRIKDLLFKPAGAALGELVRPLLFLPETATVEEALRRCRGEGSKAAFVVDEYGSLAGLITIEDLLEEIVGEIADEYDVRQPPDVEALEAGLFRVRGRLSLREWQQVSGVQCPEMGVDTVGGLVTALLGTVPEAGDTAACGGLEFTVESVERRRAESVLVRVLPPPATAPEGRDA